MSRITVCGAVLVVCLASAWAGPQEVEEQELEVQQPEPRSIADPSKMDALMQADLGPAGEFSITNEVEEAAPTPGSTNAVAEVRKPVKRPLPPTGLRVVVGPQ
jgi:hypothetical protein